jgi:AcrR family transcriptional regulator
MPASKTKRSYHHGDLRHALLEAAWQLVSERGLDALTLREVARKVGVTHAAPYHHFPTREALLDALEDEGFAALRAQMLRVLADLSDPGARLSALGRAYIDFARDAPERVQVMFRRRTAPAREPPAGEDDVFVYLLEAVRTCQVAGVAPAGDAHELALTAWSLVHGFVKLWLEGPLELMPPYDSTRFELLREAVLTDLRTSWRARALAERSALTGK